MTNWWVNRVLAGLRFPAPRWRILAQAELYGVDGMTHERLIQLPERMYRDSEEVASALDGFGRPQR